MRYLIAYDIRDPCRLRRVHRHLTQYARAIQYSVYLYDGNETGFARCVAGLHERIDPCHDDVRIYGIGAPGQLLTAGRELNPEGVWLSG